MSENRSTNIIILGLAVVGALVLAPWILLVLFGLSITVIGLALRLFLWMLIGLISGYITRGRGYGPVGDIALGIFGGLLGTWIFRLVGLGGFASGLAGSVVAGVAGALLLIYLVRLIVASDFAA